MPRAERSGPAIKIDVVVVGGGLQGLLLLDELSAAGRSCVLVSTTDLGHGQTLHSHGLLNTGFGFAGPRLREIRDRLVLPFLRSHRIPTYGSWFLLSPDEVDVGEAVGPRDLPDGFDAGGVFVRRVPELNFPKRTLIETLARDHMDRIVRGNLVELSGARDVQSVKVRTVGAGKTLTLAPAAVILATGTGTKRLAGSLVGATGQLATIRHRRVHIICVRGPVGSLPEASVLSTAGGFNLVAHADGVSRTWYSTPFQDDDPSFDDVPDDAQSPVDSGVVIGGLQRLEKLFPEIAGTPELRFAAYAGYRQDVGDVAGTPLCEMLQGMSNVVVALPSLVVNAWSNAKTVAGIVDGLAVRRTPQPEIPGAGVGVRVAPLREDAADIRWRTWRQLQNGEPPSALS